MAVFTSFADHVTQTDYFGLLLPVLKQCRHLDESGSSGSMVFLTFRATPNTKPDWRVHHECMINRNRGKCVRARAVGVEPAPHRKMRAHVGPSTFK